MSVSFAVDDKGDLKVGSEIELLDGINSLIQDVKTRLRLVEGEYHFKISEGLPYFDMLKFSNKANFERQIINEILKDDRVKTAEIITDEFTKGKLSLEIEITTNENQTIRI